MHTPRTQPSQINFNVLVTCIAFFIPVSLLFSCQDDAFFSSPRNEGSPKTGVSGWTLGAPQSMQCRMERGGICSLLPAGNTYRVMLMMFICPFKLHFVFLPIKSLNSLEKPSIEYTLKALKTVPKRSVLEHMPLLPPAPQPTNYSLFVFLGWISCLLACFSGQLSVISNSKYLG